MKRRDFLKDTLLLSAGGLLLPPVFFSSCRKSVAFDEVSYKGKVLIVGAGAAGLYAGYILKSKGIDFTILEASGTYGGRMGKLTGFADYDLDTGAQWLHGRNSIMGDLVHSKKVKITPDNTENMYWFNGNVVSALPEDPFIFESDQLPDESFKDYAHEKGLGSGYDQIIEAIAGDQGASASALSAYWNNKEEENWSSGTEDFKFARTYFDVINDHIASEILPNIICNAPVASIDHSQAKVRVATAAGVVYEADKVIVTVPVSILKLNEITFIPSLPAEQQQAMAKIGMGPGMKVFLRFSSKFYTDNLYGGSVCAAYADDTVGKTTSQHVLLAFVMGDQAARLHALGSETAITNALLAELDGIYNGQASRSFIASSVHDYTNKPYIKGAYSYSTVGIGDARRVAGRPVGNKLFFAGEAMNLNGHHQTVHGAVETGYKAVMDILSAL